MRKTSLFFKKLSLGSMHYAYAPRPRFIQGSISTKSTPPRPSQLLTRLYGPEVHLIHLIHLVSFMPYSVSRMQLLKQPLLFCCYQTIYTINVFFLFCFFWYQLQFVSSARFSYSHNISFTPRSPGGTSGKLTGGGVLTHRYCRR